MRANNGAVAPLARRHVLTLEAVNCFTGDILVRDQREVESKDFMLRELDRMAAKLGRELARSVSAIVIPRPPACPDENPCLPHNATTTASLEALEAHNAGVRYNAQGRFREAIPFFRRAAELDPNYAAAFYMLAAVHDNLGEREKAREYSAKAYSLREGVSDFERLDIAQLYFKLNGNLDEQIPTLELMKQLYEHGRSHSFLGGAYIAVGRFEEALAEAERFLERTPGPTGNSVPLAHGNLARAYRMLGRFDEAEAVLDRAIAEKRDTAGMRAERYALAFLEGDASAMEAQVRWATGGPHEHMIVSHEAEAAMYSGRVRDARRLFTRAATLADRAGLNEVGAQYRSIHALGEAVYGNRRPERGGNTADDMRSTLSGEALLATALAGDMQRMHARIRQIQQDRPQDTLMNAVWIPTAQAAAQLRHDVSTDVIDLLDAANSYEPAPSSLWAIYTRGLAYLALRRGGEAAAEFQKILAHRGIAPLSVLHPLSQLGLARACALTGDVPPPPASTHGYS